MNGTLTSELFKIERTPARTRLLLRHEPALLPGPLTPPRERSRALQHLAREVAGRLNESRTPQRRRLRLWASAAWSPALALQQK